ncbi:hypothetical protein AVEN_93534-1 [Araneus ventricosus]|uniref:Uncharacterized protein n=1 Tax=Araneus ventricosus TaxID=182803 RepID=A0A4Y2APM5_ARAVE|nr:hypothetical protein AVEN_93534-1 [Araneus ventricosus]
MHISNGLDISYGTTFGVDTLYNNTEDTVLPPRENPQTPDMLVAVVTETGYPTAFWGEGKGFISFGADRTGGSLISFCTSAENEFLA